jgi:hypothetical protein
MTQMTESKLAMYEGMIALAWADHALSPEEKAELHALIDSNPKFSATQRTELHTMVDRKVLLENIWPRVTEAVDRAHLLDMAASIFHYDGTYDASEREVYDAFLKQHLATIDVTKITEDVRMLAADLASQRAHENEALEAYVKTHGPLAKFRKYFQN